jgi:hypothetical protein
MKNIIKKISTKLVILVLLICGKGYSQVNVLISNVTVNYSGVSSVDLGTSEYKTVRFKVTVTKPNELTLGICSMVIGTTNSFGTFTPQFNPETLDYQANNTGSVGVKEFTLYATDLDFNGSCYLVVKFEQTISPFIHAESNHVPLRKTPTYSLTQSQTSIDCGSVTPVNFSITSNAPPSVNQYQWNYGNGWINFGGVNGSTLTLTPTTSLLGNVSVTPVYNGVTQPPITSPVSLTPFNPSNSSITGNTVICPNNSATYSMSNIGTNTVTWSISNSSLATLSSTTGTSVTVTGVANGTVVLTGVIKNACDQTSTKTFDINIGSATITNYQIQGGYDNVPVGSNSIFTITDAIGETSYSWSIIPISTNCSNSALPTITSNGYLSRKVNWSSNCTGQYRVRCQAINSCGGSWYSERLVKVFNSSNNPCPVARYSLRKNPIKSYEIITLNDGEDTNLIDDSNLTPCNNQGLRMVQNIKIYNLSSKEVFSKNYDNPKEINISNLNLEKGFYIIHITNTNGEIQKEKLIIE